MKINTDVMRARLEEIDIELRTIHEEAGEAALNEDQQARWDALDSEASEIRTNIADAEAAQAKAEARAEAAKRWGGVQVAPTAPENPFDIRGLSGADLVEHAKRAFDPDKIRGSQKDGAGEVLRKVEDFADRKLYDESNTEGSDLARYALVHGSPAYRSAFTAWIKAAAKGNAAVLTEQEAEAVRASMSLTSANGGYALPTLFDPTLIMTGAMTKNPIRRIARTEQGTQDKWNGVTVSNVATYWKGENLAFTDGSPTTGTVQIDAGMLTAYVTGSYEIFQDSDLLAQLPGVIGQSIDMAEGVAFVSGSGSDAPLGIVTAVSGTAGSLVTATTRGSFTAASGQDTLNLFGALPSRYEDSSKWVMNKLIYLTIAQQTFGTAGGKIIDMTNQNVILDSEVVRASSMPSATTSGNILAVLGDFSQYIIYDRIGVNVEFIQNVTNASGVPIGQRGLVAYKRVGAKPSDLDAFRLLKA